MWPYFLNVNTSLEKTKTRIYYFIQDSYETKSSNYIDSRTLNMGYNPVDSSYFRVSMWLSLSAFLPSRWLKTESLFLKSVRVPFFGLSHSASFNCRNKCGIKDLPLTKRRWGNRGSILLNIFFFSSSKSQLSLAPSVTSSIIFSEI